MSDIEAHRPPPLWIYGLLYIPFGIGVGYVIVTLVRLGRQKESPKANACFVWRWVVKVWG